MTPAIKLFVEQTALTVLPENIQNEIVSMRVWLGIENSFLHRGPDVYTTRIRIQSKRFGTQFTKEKSEDLYKSIRISFDESSRILMTQVKKVKSKKRKLEALKKAYSTSS
jgi:ribosome-associated translation inhibitor RaiA